MTTATTTTADTPTTASPMPTTKSRPNTLLSVDVSDLVQILQVQLPQLHHETIIYEHKMQMEDTKEQYRTLFKEADYLRKKLLTVVQDNNTYRKAQERMESQIYAQEQDLAQTQKQLQLLTKRNKSLEKRLENELQSYENDRALWQQREHELAVEIKRWATQDRNLHPRRTRSATASNIWTPQRPNTVSDISMMRNTCIGMGPLFEDSRQSSPEGLSIATPRDAKSKAQEKLIADYKSELEQQKVLLHETLSTAEAHVQRVEHLEQELASLRQVNASLMEDNESYQMLLHEKTIAGEFPKKSDIAPTSFTLAAELDKVHQQEQGTDGACCSCQHAAASKKLSEDNRLLQESNKALTLYMNKILLKIVDNHNLVDVLNIDEDEEQLQQEQPHQKQQQKQQQQHQHQAEFGTGSSSLSHGTSDFSKRQHYRASSAQPVSLSCNRKKEESLSTPPPAASSGFRLSGSHWTTPIKWVAGRARAESLSKLL